MGQNNIYLDDVEEDNVKLHKEKWGMKSKQEAIKKMLRDFKGEKR